MRPYIVIVPGHAFLGVAMGVGTAASIEYWETTDLGGGAMGSQANVDGDGKYADAQAHAQVRTVLDIAELRARGFEPME
jgi:predicted secreted protein